MKKGGGGDRKHAVYCTAEREKQHKRISKKREIKSKGDMRETHSTELHKSELKL